jgi:hypothetical protein
MRFRSRYLAAAVSVIAGLGVLSVLSRSNEPSMSGAPLNQAPPSTTTSTSTPSTTTSTTVTASTTTTAPQLPVAAMQAEPPRQAAARAAPPAAAMTIEQRGAAALALIKYPWAWTGYQIVYSGPRDGLHGYAQGATKRIDVYVRPRDSIAVIAWITAHEIGHAVDFEMTTEQEHADYRRIRGLDDRPWFPACETCSDYASPAGDWAETFAAWLLGKGPFVSRLGPPPSAAQLEALGPLFAATAPTAAVPTAAPTATPTTPPATTQPAPPPAATAPPGPPASSPPRPPGLLDSLFG